MRISCEKESCPGVCAESWASNRIQAFISAVDFGDEGARTPDPLLAKQVLYQLSYIPMLELEFAFGPFDSAQGDT